ncbi:MAG TPA: class II aldolase/adducin family protein [Kofleriaceae bacterium]|nr:class II aldolase/adducin family protein [Kofleriaceae bacterium]
MRRTPPTFEDEVRLAARALARHRLVHAYGHVSARVDQQRFVVTPPHPLGRIQLDTPLVPCSIDRDLPEAALPEVRLHQEIYRARPDVGAICRFQSPHVMALSAIGRTPHVLHGLGAYFAPRPPMWDDPTLVRDRERAAAVAVLLGSERAIVLRGNGAVTVGPSVREAACHAFFLEDAAQIALAVLPSGEHGIPYNPGQAARRGAGDTSLYDRMWEFLVDDDVDLPEVNR